MLEGSSVMLLSSESSAFDIAHSTFLVQLTQFFFDSIHAEERHTYHWTSHFLRFFMTFADECIHKNMFEKDELNNVRFKH